jgi:hypothetical protein
MEHPTSGQADAKLQVPPLRFAPVGMTRLGLRFSGNTSCLGNTSPLTLSSRPERTRISYFAAFSNGDVCDSPQREAHELYQRHQISTGNPG